MISPKLIGRKPLKHGIFPEGAVQICDGMVRHRDGPVRGSVVFVPPDLFETVGFLCVEYDISGNGLRRINVGTCFFVTVWNQARDAGFGYIVTAKHVWESHLKEAKPAYLRLNKHSTKPGESGVQYLPLPTDWFFHEDTAVDLAVLPFGTIQTNFVCSSLPFDAIITTPEFLSKIGRLWPPGIGEPLVFVGLLHQYAGVDRNFPIARRGHLALVTNEKIDGEYGPSEYYLADLLAYPGHSGGPVWVDYEGTLFLLGVMTAGYKQELLLTSGRKRKVEQYSLGISLVVPVEKLKEILLSPELQEKREHDKPRLVVKPIPVANLSNLA